MENETNKSLQDSVLDERARNSRRNCLIISSIALLISLTGQVPTQIMFFGVHFKGAEQSTVLCLLFLLTLIIYLDFWAKSVPCFIDYIGEFRYYIKPITKLLRTALPGTIGNVQEAKKKLPTSHTNMGKENPRTKRAKDKNDFVHKYNSITLFFCFMRIIIEVITPIFVGGYALYALYGLYKQETHNLCVASIAVNASGGQDKVIHFQNSLTLSHIEQSTVTLVLDTSTCTVQHTPHPTTEKNDAR